MELIKQPEWKINIEYSHVFAHERGTYAFTCDKNGKPLGFSPKSKKLWDLCHSGDLEVEDRGVRKEVFRYWEPAVGACECGKELELPDPLDNFCACGQCYNSSAQRVTPSSECDEQGHPFDHDF